MDNHKLNFITTYLRHRSAYTAYCIAYNVEDQSRYESIMSAAQQLMDDPEVGGLIRSVLEHVHYEVEQEIRAQQKTELLTIQRKRELLANIATGEMYAIQNYKGKDCNQCTQMVRPTINQMLKAIDLDSKLAGHYSVRQFTVDNTEMEYKTPKDDNLSRPFRGIGGNPQQNATKEQSPLPGSELGEVHSENSESAAMLQQIATKNTLESQQNTTKNTLAAGKAPDNIEVASLHCQKEDRSEVKLQQCRISHEGSRKLSGKQ